MIYDLFLMHHKMQIGDRFLIYENVMQILFLPKVNCISAHARVAIFFEYLSIKRTF